MVSLRSVQLNTQSFILILSNLKKDCTQLSETLEQIAATLDTLRQNPMTRRRYPKEVWDSIFQLTKTYSLNEICRRLRLNLTYLKDKMAFSQRERLDFANFPFRPDYPATIPLNSAVAISMQKSMDPFPA